MSVRLKQTVGQTFLSVLLEKRRRSLKLLWEDRLSWLNFLHKYS